ncbi:winged helix-turn-helix domain-containing protein [Kitasatospora sp. NPDC059648]|uniref:winged helix-turn-helix domain-containing protein n=1 Tax=Kitasatospora sp. NPDC059648 TaxID=3346894 RepID=UPI0036A979B6
MIRIGLTAEAVARTRFAISPLFQAMHLLFILGRRPQALPRERRLRARDVIAERRLWLLAALAVGPHGYTPDFLTPQPTAYRPPVCDELHQVATAAPGQVRQEMMMVLNGLTEAGLSAHIPSRLVLDAIDAGEDRFAERLAGELDAFWTGVFLPDWPDLSARLERDIGRRSEHTARHGLSAMAAGLHPRLHWADDALAIAYGDHSDFQITAPGVILVPGAFQRGLMLSLYPAEPPMRRTPVLVYPALADEKAAADRHLGELIGGSRASILADLTEPRSTAELADRLGLSPSTVSYHLQILHRTGLVRRTRRSRQVLYQAVGDPRSR